MSVTLVLLAALALPGAAPERLRPSRSSADEITRYAVARVCLPVVRDDAPFAEAARTDGFPWKAEPGAFALNGTTPNVVQLRGPGCYFRIDRGDPDKLRNAVLESLAAAGAPPRTPPLFDSGAAGGGPHRQEAHCLAAVNRAGQPLAVLISRKVGTSLAPALQVSVYVEAKRCAPAP